MVQSRKVELEAIIEVDMPLDIINDKKRLKGVENGLVRSISDGLYQQGVSFRIDKTIRCLNKASGIAAELDKETARWILGRQNNNPFGGGQMIVFG